MNALEAIQLVSGLSTLPLAAAAFWQIKVSKASVEAARQAVRATEESVAATRDEISNSLRPIVSVSVVEDAKPNDGGEWKFKLKLLNEGVGPAILRAVTTRDDVKPSDVHRWPLRDSVLAAGKAEHMAFSRLNHDWNGEDNGKRPWITSLSVWYEDVFHNVFRTRVVLQYAGDKEDGPPTRQAQELMLAATLPPAMGEPFPPFPVSRIEGGCAVRCRSGMDDLYRIEVVERLKGTSFPGNEATGRKPVTLKDCAFRTDFPSVVLECGGAPFVLTGFKNRDRDEVGVYVEPEAEFWRGKPGMYLTANARDLGDLKVYGLTLGAHVDRECWDLYASIVKSLIPTNSPWLTGASQ